MNDNMSRVEGILLGDSTVVPLSRVEMLLINLLGNIIGEQEVRRIVSEAIAEVIDSSADAFDILNDLEDWLETHEEAFASITESIASSYDSTHVYSEGDYCTHNYKLYKCIHTMSQTEAWTDAHWSQVNVIESMTISVSGTALLIP